MNKNIVEKHNVSKKIYVYDILRVITTLLVILSHCGYYSIITKYGGVDYWNLMNLGQYNMIFYNIFLKIVKFIYTFHMPLFIALSGALFYNQIKNNRFKNIKLLIENKYKRLIIPFFVVTIMYSVPIKFISGYFDNSNNLLKDIILGQVFIQGNTYLWFLPTLFLCFIIIYFIEKHITISKISKIIIFLLLNIFSYKCQVNIIKYVFQYIIWFYMGFLFESKRKRINTKLKQYKNIWVTILIVLIISVILYIVKEKFWINSSFILKAVDKIIIIFQGIMGCSIIYLLSLKLSFSNIRNNYIYKEISETSFGLYLYSDPINYFILSVIYRKFGSAMFITELGSITIIILRIVITLTIPFIITKVLRKLNIKYVV